MKTVCEKNQCAGCMACVNICPKKAVKIKDDMDAFNAIIDKSKCVNCGACYRVCQKNSMPKATYPLYWYEGWIKNENQRKQSSSGGFAQALMQAFVKMGGVVCSCVFDKGEFSFMMAENESDLKRFIGSKYVKSNPNGVYEKILRYIKKGDKVLFVGLPCQVAAVKNYIKNSDLLYTVDLICHGTPSPAILNRFLRDYGMSLETVNKIEFRNKTDFRLICNQKKFTIPMVGDSYTMTFLDSTSYTENCYMCRYAQLNRVSDITIGDSWGSELPADIQKQGVSLALCQTEKGNELLKKTNTVLLPVDIDRAVEFNHQLSHPSEMTKHRKKFFYKLKKGKKFDRVIFECYPNRYIKNLIKTMCYYCKKKKGQFGL